MHRVVRNPDLVVLVVAIAPWLVAVAMLYQLQIVRAGAFRQSVQKIEDSQFRAFAPRRGQIYVQDKYGVRYPVAVSLRRYDLYFNLKRSQNETNEFAVIQRAIPRAVLPSGAVSSVLIARDLDDTEREAVEQLHLESIFFEEHFQRAYPEGRFLSSVIGFAARNDQGALVGRYGLEREYEQILGGEEGYQFSLDKVQAPQNGSDIVLNIDYFVQKEAERILRNAVKKFGASSGMIVVARPTGQIIALAEDPSFDPNRFNEMHDYRTFSTRFIQNYEPGSVMKAITYLSAIEHGVFNEQATYNDTGAVVINGWRIENFDHKGRGRVTLAEALEQSLNTGAIYVERLIGHPGFLATLRKFRFDQPPEVDLPNRTPGNLRNLFSSDVRDVNFATASFGHGISISPAHLVAAINAIANGGNEMSLRLVAGTINGDQLQEERPVTIDRVVSPATLPRITALLERVVLNGSGKLIRTPGFRLGGKTGSAFIPFEDKRGYSDQVINTFLVIFPLSHPEFMMLVRIDRPSGLAGVTTVPPAKELFDFLVNYYNIQPDNPTELAAQKL